MQEKWNGNRRYLETERDHLFAQLAGVEVISAGDSSSRGSFSQTEEAAMAFAEIEKGTARRANLMHRLTEVQSALERLSTGTYGTCQRCGESIPIERLNAVPQASHCLKCKPGPRKVTVSQETPGIG